MSADEFILANLNDQQRLAVTTGLGPVLIIAGAGSGKTRALTHRIAWLIQEKGIPAHRLLAVTFTNKAASEMKERVKKLLNPPAHSDESELVAPLYEGVTGVDLPTIGTFHSVCVQILRRDIHHLGRENRFVIYDDSDQKTLMRQIFDELKIDPKEYNPKAVLGAISWAKAHLIPPEKYVANSRFTTKVSEIYPLYHKKLLANNGLDFDDLLMVTAELFTKHPEILDHYQEKWHFVSVDEYQDTNHAQAILTNLLAEKYRNLCVVGDPDQSIYSWRGADISNITEFKRRYKETVEIKLEQNYRSTQIILDAANHAIRKNKSREDKKLWTKRAGGEKIFALTLNDEREEAEFIAREIEDCMRTTPPTTPSKGGKYGYKDFVVLYRTNAQSRAIEEVFLRHGLPHRIIGGVKFYARKEVKDVLAYLRLIQNQDDNLSLLRIINVPPRKIGTKTIEVLQEYANQTNGNLFEALSHADSLALPPTKKETLGQFLKDLEHLRKLNRSEKVAGLIKNILARTKLKDYWNQEGTAEGETRYENVLELTSVASKYNDLEPGLALATFLEEVALLTDADRSDDRENSVTLMTLHSAKGLEFPIVFLAGLEQNIFPHSRTLLEPRELEEERRLFYVGLTRAMDRLFLLCARQRLFFGETQMNAPSEFLEDIPKELLAEESRLELKRRKWGEMESSDESESSLTSDLSAGDRVRHPIFGAGSVQKITGGVAEVRFDDQKFGTKKLALSIAPLEKI